MLDTSDWAGITDISAGRDAVFGIRSDGTVAVSGGGYEEVKDWSGIRHIEAMNGLAVGLREDGTVVAAGNMADRCEFGNWTGITQLVSGACSNRDDKDYVLIAGLRGDGYRVHRCRALLYTGDQDGWNTGNSRQASGRIIDRRGYDG